MGKRGFLLIGILVSSVAIMSVTGDVESRASLARPAWLQEPELRHNRELVRKAQRALAEQGYYGGSIDGIIGPETREGLRNFQRAHRLPVTGRLDEATLKKLGIKLEQGSEDKEKGLFGQVTSGAKSVGEAVADGAVTGAKATKKGAVVGAEATAEGATTAGKATAKGATTAGKSTTKAATTAAEATGKGATATGRAVKKVFTASRSDEDIHQEIQEKFDQDSQIDPSHFDVSVSDGTVTLTLRRGSQEELERAVSVVKQIEGVKKVIPQRKSA